MQAYRPQPAGRTLIASLTRTRLRWAALTLAAVSPAFAQPAAPGSTTPPNPADLRGVEAAERAARPDASSRPGPQPSAPAAIVNGQPIPWEELLGPLAEAAGGQVLQETILDRLLEEQARSRGITVSPDDIAAERALLTAAVSRDAQANPDNAERLLESVRRSRGLGEVRFAKLLHRNALMRRLVAPTIGIADEEVAQAFQMLHGPKYRARVITAPTRQQAAALRERAVAEPAAIRSNFIALAAAESTDPSSPRGGQIDPISPADPQYPATVRDAVLRLQPGEVSPVLAVDQGFAILLLEEAIPADNTTLEAVSDQIRAEVRIRRERLAMEELARRLLKSAQISIPDRSLDWSWRSVPAPGR